MGTSLGGTAATTYSSSGALRTYQSYDAYGEQRAGGTLLTENQFTGQKLDDTGLYYFRARYYDPQIGHFVSPDTLVPDATSVFDYNRFMFVVGNPLKFNDPTGHIYDPSDATGGMIGPVNWAGAARSTIQLSVDVATKAASTAIVAEGFRESVPLQQPTKAETTSYPLSDPLEGYDSWSSAPALPSQQVWADPLPMVEIGDNVVYGSWLGENVNIQGVGSSGSIKGYTRATSDLAGGLVGAIETYEALTGLKPQIDNLQSLAPTDLYIEMGKIEVYFRPTSRSGTAVIEIIDHGNKTNEKIHFN